MALPFPGYVIASNEDDLTFLVNTPQVVDTFNGFNLRSAPTTLQTWSIPDNTYVEVGAAANSQIFLCVHAFGNQLITRGQDSNGDVSLDAVYVYGTDGTLINTINDNSFAGFNDATTICDNGDILFGISDSVTFPATQLWKCHTTDSSLTVSAALADASFSHNISAGPLYAYSGNTASLATDGGYTTIRLITLSDLSYIEVDLSSLPHGIANVAYSSSDDCVILILTDGTVYKYSSDLATQQAVSADGLLGRTFTDYNINKRMCNSGFARVANQDIVSGVWTLYKVSTSSLTIIEQHLSTDVIDGVPICPPGDGYPTRPYTHPTWNEANNGFFMPQFAPPPIIDLFIDCVFLSTGVPSPDPALWAHIEWSTDAQTWTQSTLDNGLNFFSGGYQVYYNGAFEVMYSQNPVPENDFKDPQSALGSVDGKAWTVFATAPSDDGFNGAFTDPPNNRVGALSATNVPTYFNSPYPNIRPLPDPVTIDGTGVTAQPLPLGMTGIRFVLNDPISYDFQYATDTPATNWTTSFSIPIPDYAFAGDPKAILTLSGVTAYIFMTEPTSTPPPPAPIQQPSRLVRDPWDVDEWGRFYPGAGYHQIT